MDQLALTPSSTQRIASPTGSIPTRDGLVGTIEARKAIEALGRSLTARERHVRLMGPPGVGKSLILNHFLQAFRSPWVKVAIASGALGEMGVLERLIQVLNGNVPGDRATAESLWTMLGQRLRTARLQGQTIVLAIDDASALADTPVLARLAALVSQASTSATLIEVVRTSPYGMYDDNPDPLAELDQLAFGIHLKPLTRAEAGLYLRSKHLRPGKVTGFSDAAITALHAFGNGLPRRIDRLAMATLALAEEQDLTEISSELVDEVGHALGL